MTIKTITRSSVTVVRSHLICLGVLRPNKKSPDIYRGLAVWTQRGMIPRPSDYESAALTN